MYENIKIIVISVVLIVMCYVMFFAIDRAAQSAAWNDGQCKCGGQLVHVHTEERYYSEIYIYKCNTCGEVKEFDIKW